MSLLYKDGEFKDKEWAGFIAEMYSEGHSFFTYISDSVDSLSSCCRLKNPLQKEFMFTNGMISEATGSKSVITLNLNRIVQKFIAKYDFIDVVMSDEEDALNLIKTKEWKDFLNDILERVYIYHEAYNEILWDNKNSGLSPIVDAGFVDLNKLYLTVGINGLNQAAEFLTIKCNDNIYYKEFCQLIFSQIKEQNAKHRTKTMMFNTEQVPAEGLAVKNYNWDKENGYWIPKDTNLYASYIFKPNDASISVLEKLKLHGSEYIGEYLDGGAAAHINLNEHLSKVQYLYLMHYAGKVGCQYFTFNIPNSECNDCGYITKHPLEVCPKCGSKHIITYDRIIGYLTAIKNWSEGRQIEQKSRVYSKKGDIDAEIQ